MQNILITGTGRPQALGINLVRRYLEHGDRVFACVRKSTDTFTELLHEYPGELTVLVMDISDTWSVRAASESVAAQVDHLDTIINNAVTTAPDCNAGVMEANPDNIAASVNVGASGPLRVIQAFYPLLKKSGMGLVVNISSEAGSIGACYRTNMTDYAVTKAALNMITKTVWNAWKDETNLNILCLHPGWMRTNEGNAKAPLEPYEHAEALRCLFEARRHIKDGELFITYTGEAYPW